MANHSGTSGVVKVGTNVIAEVRGFEFVEGADTIEDTVLGDTWRTRLPGLKTWSGSLDAWWDETDTNGQVALAAGATATVNLYPEGTATSATYYSGTVVVTGHTRRNVLNGMVEATITFEGNGALSTATAT